MNQWIVVVGGSKMIDEIRSRPELSLAAGLAEVRDQSHAVFHVS